MDKALKQRLVGASVLIALAVVVVPMLLDGRPEGSAPQTRMIELPSRPGELDFETRRFPLEVPSASSTPAPDDGAESVGRLPAPARVESVPQTQSMAAASVAEDDAGSSIPVESASPQPDEAAPAADIPAVGAPAPSPALATAEAKTEAPRAPATSPADAPAEAGRYVVQVASLASDANARRLMASLQQQGLPVLLDSVESDVGRLHRVRAGPFGREADAIAAVNRIRKDIGDVNPRVVDLHPEQSAAVTAPSDPLVRWVVQVGSFSEAGNAETLVSRLRAEGLSAYQETVGSTEAAIYRVRVGPYLERDAAMQTRQSLLSALSIEGVVMSAD